MGLNIVSLANNHVMDLGEQGLYDTLEALARYEIAYSGAGRTLEEALTPVLTTHNGVTIAVLSFLCIESKSVLSSSATTTRAGVAVVKGWPVCRLSAEDSRAEFVAPDERDVRSMEDAIRAAAKRAAVVLVSLHTHLQSRYSTEPGRPIAHAAVAAGAHLVLAHGSHAIEPIERYRDALIFHGLGNFFFQFFEKGRVIADIGHSWAYRKLLYSFTTSSDYWEGLAIKINILSSRISRVQLFPLDLTQDGTPHLATQELSTEILDDLQARSRPYGAEVTILDGSAEVT